jgi:serine/threonine-protein kinase
MSPEQWTGDATLDGRSDVYSLACVLYELLAGQPPFTGATVDSLRHQHLNVAPRPVSALRSTVSKTLDKALETALAKAPADRQATAAEFAAAITTIADPKPPWYKRGRRMAAIGAAVVIAIVGGILLAPSISKLISNLLRPGDTPATDKRDWVLVAEFDGPPDDPGLAVAARELVAAGLDQSKVAAAVPSDQLRAALRLAGKPDTTRVDAVVARELAYRSAVRAVVEGHIRRLGRGYSIVLRLNDAEKGTALLAVNDAAKTEDDLIPVLGRITRRFCDRLGEARSDIRATRERSLATTPSFEAYRKFVRGRELQNQESDDRGSIVMFREALAIDPDFAGAWMWIGFAFDHLGEVDSSRWAFEEALRRPERLGEGLRLYGEAFVAEYKNDLPAALAANNRLVREYPSPSAYANRGAVLANMGRYEEALQDQARGIQLEPFEPRQWIRSNQFEYLLVLGRQAEAESVAIRLKGSNGRLAPLALATAGADWAKAESRATALLDDPTSDANVRARAAIALASEEAARGRVAASRRMLEQAQRIAEAGSPTRIPHGISRTRLLLIVAGGGTPEGPNAVMARDTSVAGLITQGWWAAAAGDTARARQLLRRAQGRPQSELALQGASPALLEAWVAARAGRWKETAQILGPAARQGDEFGFVADGAGRVPMRWLVGEAWEQLGHPDSAAAYFELALSPEMTSWRERQTVRMVSSFAHLRLVLLYARMGRLEDAKGHWTVFSETVRTPDPEIQPTIAEARAALTSAEGMARSARR